MIIGLCGRAGSGKDTAAEHICESGSPHRDAFGAVSFAYPMKLFCQEVFGFSYEQLWGPSELRNAGDPRYVRPDGTLLSPREALQKLGTEWGRSCYPNIWVDLAIRRARELHTDHALITDCRFENEVDAIKAAGGKVIRIIRPGAEVRATHASERLDTIPDHYFDATILNDSTQDVFEQRALETVLELIRGNQSGAW